MQIYHYIIEGEDETLKNNRKTFESHIHNDLIEISSNIGEDFYNNHDGWEHNWPIQIHLFDHDNIDLGIFDIELEETQAFFGSKL